MIVLAGGIKATEFQASETVFREHFNAGKSPCQRWAARKQAGHLRLYCRGPQRAQMVSRAGAVPGVSDSRMCHDFHHHLQHRQREVCRRFSCVCPTDGARTLRDHRHPRRPLLERGLQPGPAGGPGRYLRVFSRRHRDSVGESGSHAAAASRRVGCRRRGGHDPAGGDVLGRGGHQPCARHRDAPRSTGIFARIFWGPRDRQRGYSSARRTVHRRPSRGGRADPI